MTSHHTTCNLFMFANGKEITRSGYSCNYYKLESNYYYCSSRVKVDILTYQSSAYSRFVFDSKKNVCSSYKLTFLPLSLILSLFHSPFFYTQSISICTSFITPIFFSAARFNSTFHKIVILL